MKRLLSILLGCCLFGTLLYVFGHGLFSSHGWIPHRGRQFSVAISEMDRQCHTLDEPIKVRIKIHNISEETIPVPDVFKFSTNYPYYTNIIAYLKPAFRIKDPGFPCVYCGHAGRFPGTSNFFEVPVGGMFEKIVGYRLPPVIFMETAKPQPLKPGWYFLRISYALFRYDEHGRLKMGETFDTAYSNRIVICIK